jgi:hypothetical protein
VIVFHYLDTPVGISIFTQPVERIHQTIDGIDVSSLKSLNRVVFDEGNLYPPELLRAVRSCWRGFSPSDCHVPDQDVARTKSAVFRYRGAANESAACFRSLFGRAREGLFGFKAGVPIVRKI